MPRCFSFRLERIRRKGRRTARSHPTFGAWGGHLHEADEVDATGMRQTRWRAKVGGRRHETDEGPLDLDRLARSAIYRNATIDQIGQRAAGGIEAPDLRVALKPLAHPHRGIDGRSSGPRRWRVL
jgi:hypothetical protein